MVMQPTPEQLKIIEKARGRQDNPSGQTPAQAAIISKVRSAQTQQQAPVENQRGRTFMQGMTFGASEEIEAAVRSVLPDRLGGGDYDVIRNELRQKISAYQKENPGEALTLEVIGAIAPTIAAQFIPGVGQAASSSNAIRLGTAAATNSQKAITAGKFLGTNAALGGAAGVGYSEQEDAGGMAGDAGIGAIYGGAGGVAGAGISRGVGNAVSKGIEKLSARSGTDTAAQAYLTRLREQTGLSLDDLIQSIRDGNVIADFEQLSPDIKAIVNMGGKSSAEILSASGQRSAMTQQGAIQGLHDNLAPGADSNVLKTVTQNNEALKQAQGVDYKQAFKDMPRVPNDVAAKMLEVAKRNPEALKQMELVAKTDGRSPLFKLTKDSEPAFLRFPSLEDAERLLRGVNSSTQKAFKNENNDYGNSLKNLEGELRPGIDVASPPLAKVRKGWSDRLNSEELYKKGRKKVLTMDVDELSLEVESLNSKQMDSLRLGLMSAIKNRLTLKISPVEDLTKDTRKMGIALRLLLPPKQAEAVLDKLRIHNNARLSDQYIQPKAGSGTNIMGVKQERMAGINAEDMLNLSNPATVMRLLRLYVRNTKPELSDQQRSQIAKTLYETDPDVVMNILTSAGNATALNLQAARTISGIVKGLRNTSVMQTTQDKVE